MPFPNTGGLTTAQTEKLDRNKGSFDSLSELEAAHATAIAGDWALVNTATVPLIYVWSTVTSGWEVENSNPGFMVESQDMITLTASYLTPVSPTGLSFVGTAAGFTIVDGGVQNNTGRTLAKPRGWVSAHLSNSNSSSRTIYIYSARSGDDGVTWSDNDNSGRQQIISGTGEEFGTKDSEATDWLDGEIIEFRMYASATGPTADSVSFTTENGTVTGPSFRWWMQETQ